MSKCRELEQNQPVRFVFGVFYCNHADDGSPINVLCGFLRFTVLRSVQ